MTPVFLEPDVVLFLHDQSIREYGGYHGVRDDTWNVKHRHCERSEAIHLF